MVLTMSCGVANAVVHFLEKEDIKKSELAQATLKYVYAYSMKVYDMPTKESDVREIVPYAKEIIVLEEKLGWAKVLTINDRVGFCNAKQLTDVNPNNLHTAVYSQQKDVPVYLRPSVDAPLIDYLMRNQKVELISMTPMGDWMRLKKGKYYGYVQRQRMDYERYKKGTRAWIGCESAKVYYDPELDSVLGTLYFGQKLWVVDKTGKRAKIRSPRGLIGYCDLEAITDKDPNGLDQIVYTQVSGNYLFTSSTDISGRRNVEVNAEMTLVAVDRNNFWARVLYNGEYYYAPYVYLSHEKRLGDYKRVRTTQAAVLREGTKRSSTVVTALPAGTDLWLIGATDNRAKVTTSPDANGKRYTGYVDLQYIS
ncbi:MAG: hypothetical protein IKE76_11040 [Clostridia bacterium]|nr:hypothetical protein [Clostridia bacterium]